MAKNTFHPLDAHIGICLRRLRNKKHYSLEQVGEWLNLSKQQVSRLEHGKSRLNVVQLFQLARGFNVPISWFFEEFQDSPEEIQWVGNMVREDRRVWQPVNAEDDAQKLLALWMMLKNPAIQKQIIQLLEAMVTASQA